MKRTLQQSLAAMPARQLNLLAIGAVAIAAALVWMLAIRAPLAALRQQRVRLQSLMAAGAGAAALRVPAAAPVPVPVLPTAPAPLDLIAAISGSARDAGLVVGSAVPGAQRSVAGLRQQTLDVDASGSYGAILGWLADIEAHQPAVGITRLDLHPAQNESMRQLHLQLAVYAVESKR